MTKDSDFVELVNRLGSPPQIIWLTCGNTTKARLREMLDTTFLEALKLLQAGEMLVEISGN
jgi:predicted nuclease of predicted toxin-antitoxin system